MGLGGVAIAVPPYVIHPKTVVLGRAGGIFVLLHNLILYPILLYWMASIIMFGSSLTHWRACCYHSSI